MDQIDLNCDLGEIEGIAGESLDAQMMIYVSSINVACGGHAGDPDRIHKVVELALSQNIAIGAHPGYADRANFGRVAVPMSPHEVYELVSDQIKVVAEIVDALGGRLHHVKPHGALYNLASASPETAQAIAIAVHALDPKLQLMGLARSCLTDAAIAVGLQPLHEIFADRNYLADGSLVPRSQPNAVLHDAGKIATRAASMIKSGEVLSIDGTQLDLQFDTLCIHSDTPNAVAIAAGIRRFLADRNIAVRAVAADG
ncbi:MAG: LamB/YcsF family protein [Planctomycetota bacterium]|nr:LamB/YcsF family protein [Planctomycetota bacterium]